MQSSELAVHQQALLLLADVMHKRENLASALREGTLEIASQLSIDIVYIMYIVCITYAYYNIIAKALKFDYKKNTFIIGLAMTLKCLLEDEDGVVRERSANVMGIIARKIDVHDKGSHHSFTLLNF